MAKYKAYAEYKTISNSWLDSIPNGWALLPLKYLCTSFVKDGPHETPVFLEEGVPFLSVDGIQDNKLIFEGCRYISPSDHFRFSKKCKPVKGDVLLGKAASIGKVALVDTSREFNVWSPLAVITPIRSCLSKFIYYSLQTTMLQAQCEVYSNSNTQKNLGMSTIDNLDFAMPSDKEASTISNFLDHETAKIDNLIEKQQQLIALLKEKRQAVISHAVTKGLNPDVPMENSGVEWFGEVPAHWVVMHMRHAIVRIEQGKSPECEARNAEENEWGVLKSGCVNSGLFNEKEHKALPSSIIPNIEYEVHPGDLIMSRASGSVDLIGSMAFVYNCRTKLLLSDKTFRVIPTKKVAPEFLSHLMGSLPMRNQIKLAINGAEGLANNITKESIKSFYMVAPSFSEQIEIASFITGKNKIFDLLETKLNNSIKLLQERRTALISAAVTGKIDVRDWVAPDTQNVEEPQEVTA